MTIKRVYCHFYLLIIPIKTLIFTVTLPIDPDAVTLFSTSIFFKLGFLSATSFGLLKCLDGSPNK